MNADRKSYESIGPTTSANKGAAEAPAEPAEERGSTKRNVARAASHRTQCRDLQGIVACGYGLVEIVVS